MALGRTAAAPRIAKTATKVNGAKTASVPPFGKKGVVSPEARQRMAEAQQKRWAKKKRATKKAAAPVAATSAKDNVKPTAVKKAKGDLTDAGRKRLSEATKARWAAKKAAAAA